jgi:hypothetical protein
VLAIGDELQDLKLPDYDTTSGARREAATWRLPTCCLARRPRCARSCSGWPTPPRKKALPELILERLALELCRHLLRCSSSFLVREKGSLSA